jgi:predicted transcriptional regulator
LKTKKNELDIRTRRNIYNFILKHPGHHYREICRELKLKKNNVSYHLKYLIKYNLISESSEDGYTRYFAVKLNSKKEKEITILLSKSIPYESEEGIQELFEKTNFGKEEKKIINLFRKPICFMIIRFLFVKKDSSFNDIQNFLNKKRSTIFYHLDLLIGNDIVEINKQKKGVSYRIKNEDFIYNIFQFYFSGEELSDENGNPTGKIINNARNNIIRSYWDVAPIPFCAGYKPGIYKKKK